MQVNIIIMTKISKADQIYDYTSSKLSYLNSLADTGPGRGLLANLRRGIGRNPGELPELWGFIFERIPDELLGNENKASYAEWAIYTALTLYALHQQGNDEKTKPMNIKGISLGEAAAKLVKQEEGGEERIVKRLNLVATATSPKDLAYYLRAVIQLLSTESIPLDYARIAKEIYLMNFEESANNVTLSWGRKFYSVLYENEKEKKNEQ